MAPYSDFDELLAGKAVDILAINTPPPSHADCCMAALHAGKHSFVKTAGDFSSIPRLRSTWPENKGSLTFLANFITTIHLLQV